MLQRESNILIADNSGALEVRVINPGKVKFAKIGDIVTCSVKKMRKDINSPLVIKGQVIKVLIVCTRKGIKRNGGWLGFDKTYAIVIKPGAKGEDKYQPISSSARFSVPILREFNTWGFKKVFSSAKEVL